MTTISEETERIEKEILAPHAALAATTKGRERPEERDPLRTCYQRDRDRIVHSKAFRRLKHKTQVFFAPDGDHVRVRLTHTLEVTQVARTIARALRLNEDLAEAIALGHDMGHTPFGHAGEDVLTKLLGRPFKHGEQSLRIVEVLEDLNLTWEVRDGILNHTWTQPEPSTLEAMVVRFADRIAYLNHDVDDALRAGIITDFPKDLGDTHAERINTLVMGVVEASQKRPVVEMTPDVKEKMDSLRRFLFERVYLSEHSKQGIERAERVIGDLFRYYRAKGDDSVLVADFISGMTDRYAVRKHNELFGERQ